MARGNSSHWWLRLSEIAAVGIGWGALFVAGAQVQQARAEPEEFGVAAGGIMLRAEGGKIFLSEGGSEFQELGLKDNRETAYLMKLLGETNGSVAEFSASSMKVAEGGNGFHWDNRRKSDSSGGSER